MRDTRGITLIALIITIIILLILAGIAWQYVAGYIENTNVRSKVNLKVEKKFHLFSTFFM